MSKKIITVGFEIPGHSELFNYYTSEQSLLDADLIVFEPTFYYEHGSSYQGKTCYTDDSSFRLKEDTNHWRNELITALENGKTVFVFFKKFEEFFVQTGQKQYSGTGRNQRTTNFVAGSHNYNFFPISIPKIIAKSGNEIIYEGNPIFATFWTEFGKYLKYESYFDERTEHSIFLTKTGEKTVGSLYKVGKGNLVLLPPLKYSEEDFIQKNKNGINSWNQNGVKFGSRLVKSLVDIDKVLRSQGDKTPPPDWSQLSEYEIPQIKKIQKEITNIDNKIDSLKSKKSHMLEKISNEESLKNLLYEKGTALEKSIIEGLQLLGYRAENYNDGESEFDQIIISPEGVRFVGEAEGKDNSAINIDKFRQLESNIQEDFQKNEVSEPAIGILFGNAFRLTDPNKRSDYFTEKCLKNAKRLNSILIKTPDLFRVANYVKASKNATFARKCRESILSSLGTIVIFPEIPKEK